MIIKEEENISSKSCSLKLDLSYHNEHFDYEYSKRLQVLCKSLKLQESTKALANIYSRKLFSVDICLGKETIRNLIIISILSAQKYNETRKNYSLNFYSRKTLMTKRDIIRLELLFLELLDWKLHVNFRR